MAIYHCSVKTISRGQGRSAVGAAAYRAGEKIENERDGMTHDYTRKEGVVHTEIMTPENAPDWTKDRGTLWNEVEKSETRVNSRTAREVEVALPKELDRESQKELLRDYVKENFNDQGMIADVAIHDKGDGNPHAHILLTTRELDEDGKFGKKRRDWDKNEQVDKWRESWEKHANRYLEREGHEQRIDHRSYKDQGIDKVPQLHEGPTQRDMKAKGKELEYDKIELNREIKEQNRQLEIIARREPLLEKQKENLLEELKQITIEQPKPYLTTVPEQKPEPQQKQPERHQPKPYLTTVPEQTLSLREETVKVADVLSEARDYQRALLQEDNARAKQLEEWRQRKSDISLPYRKEAVEKYLQERWGQKWNDVQQEKRQMTKRLEAYHRGDGYSFWDKHITTRYKEDGKELRRQSQNIDYKEKDLINVIERERQELRDPRNIHAHGKYEVDKIADKLAQERDPQYKAKRETISRVEDKIIADRQGSLPERQQIDKFVRSLEKVRSENKEQEMRLPIARDRDGNRQPLKSLMDNQGHRSELYRAIDRARPALEAQAKTLERTLGRSR